MGCQEAVTSKSTHENKGYVSDEKKTHVSVGVTFVYERICFVALSKISVAL